MILDARPFLFGYKQLKIPIVDSDGLPAWPELFPLDKIDDMRDMVGLRHFSSQMMLEYISAESARLDPGALRFYDGEFDTKTGKLGISKNSDSFDLIPDSCVTGVSCYWDPSGGRARSDGSVCIIVYRDDKNRRAFIHDIRYLSVADNNLHPMASQCETVLDFINSYGQKKIAIEVNGIGNSLPEILRDVAQKRGQPVIVQSVTNSHRKETRILGTIEPLLTTGRLYAHERIKATPLLSEMLGWTPMVQNQADDGLDAVAGALKLQAVPIRTLSATLRARTDFKI